MKGFAESVLIGLLLSVSSAWAEGPIDDHNNQLVSAAAPVLVRISPADHDRLRIEAARQIRSLTGRGVASGSIIDSIRAEADPVAREARWSAWLDALASSDRLQAREVQALAELENSAPVAGVPHHDFPSRTVPAFALAPRAAVLLARHALSSRAYELAARPGPLIEALDSKVNSSAFAAGLQALAFVSPTLLAEVVEMHRQRKPLATGSSRILLKAAEVAPEYQNLLPAIIGHGDTTTARRALRLAIDRASPQLQAVAAAALARGELGGLALTAATQAGMHPDRFCWALLEDPALGADAARMLAEQSERLLEEIAARIDDASPLARLRMLLALRLRGSENARSMLGELARASWLSEQQRGEVLSWL